MGMYKHEALPESDSKTRESDGKKVSGTTPADYPLLGKCEHCHREIRAENALFADWKHTAPARMPAPPAAPPGPLTEQAITEWARQGATKKIAAHIAGTILSGRLLSYAELPSDESLADEWNASKRTVTRAKALLAHYGVLRKENGTYRVT